MGLIVGAILLLIWLWRDRGGDERQQALPLTQMEAPKGAESSGEAPLAVIKRRYAAGEIDRDEYLQMLDDLGVPSSDE